MDIEKILQYQEADMALTQLEADYNASPVMVKFNEIKENRRAHKVAIENVSNALDSLLASLNQLKGKQKEIDKEITDVTVEDFETLGDDQLAFYSKSLEKYRGELNSIDDEARKISNNISEYVRKLTTLVANFNKLSDDFAKIKEITAAYNEKDIKPKFDEAMKKLSVIKDQLDPSDLALYNETKAHVKVSNNTKVIRVFVNMRQDSCGGCGMQLSPLDFDKISQNGYVKCQNCGRIVYRV